MKATWRWWRPFMRAACITALWVVLAFLAAWAFSIQSRMAELIEELRQIRDEHAAPYIDDGR